MAEINGWEYIALKSAGSTNEEAQKYCALQNRKTVVRADVQTAGRGRRGRNWISEYGNLFCSLVFEFDLKYFGYLVMISALSLAQAVESFSKQIKPQLKWPNDVLLNGKKLSGILLEKGEGDYIIVGIGVNIASAPEKEKLLYQATSLSEHGIDCTAEEFLSVYLQMFDQNLSLFDKQKNKQRIEWLKRAYGIGRQIKVCCNSREEKGIFIGIDDDMTLLLQQGEKIKKILAGDVFFENGEINEGI